MVDLIVTTGIDQRYTVLLGQVLKEMLALNMQVELGTFKKYVYFLERCKGYEEDAKRFVNLAHDTQHI